MRERAGEQARCSRRSWGKPRSFAADLGVSRLLVRPHLLPRSSFLLLALATLASGGGCCRDAEQLRAVSPDAGYTAESRVVDCGATTPYYTRVIVRRNPGWLMASETVFEVRGKEGVVLTWVAPRELHVRCDGCDDSSIDYSSGRWRDIRVRLFRGTSELRPMDDRP